MGSDGDMSATILGTHGDITWVGKLLQISFYPLNLGRLEYHGSDLWASNSSFNLVSQSIFAGNIIATYTTILHDKLWGNTSKIIPLNNRLTVKKLFFPTYKWDNLTAAKLDDPYGDEIIVYGVVTCKSKDLFKDHCGISMLCSGSSMQKLMFAGELIDWTTNMKILLTVVNFLATLGKNVGQTPTNADECLVIGERVFLGKEYEAREDLAPSSMGNHDYVPAPQKPFGSINRKQEFPDSKGQHEMGTACIYILLLLFFIYFIIPIVIIIIIIITIITVIILN